MEEIPAHTGQLKLVYTSRYFFSRRQKKLDDRFIFTGPSIITRQDAPTFSFELLRERYPKPCTLLWVRF